MQIRILSLSQFISDKNNRPKIERLSIEIIVFFFIIDTILSELTAQLDDLPIDDDGKLLDLLV